MYQSNRHIFGAACSPTCANFALRKAAEAEEEKYPGVTERVVQSFYMEDYLSSGNMLQDLVKKAKEVKAALNGRSFNLTK